LRRLTNGQWANAHVFDLDGRIDVTPFFRLALRNHFIRSALDPQEFDPAGEVYIVGDTFNRNDAGVRAEYQLNDRSSLALDAGYNIVRWSEDHINGAPLFIDYDELSGGISYDREISEETTVNVGFTFGNSLSHAPLRPQFDGLSNFRRYRLEIGARTQVSETSGAAFRIGYERSDFRNAPSANDYSGLVFDLRFKRELTESTFFELAALRKTQVSAFNLEGGNARLTSTGGAARFETAQTENLKLALGLNYQRLEFPIAVVPNSTASGGVLVGQFAGEHRKDHLYGFSLEAAYRLSELLKARFVYSFLRRDSTLPVFTFNRNRLSLVFEIGRRNEVRGRPF
jgi:outer membrane protein assembly factor BamA